MQLTAKGLAGGSITQVVLLPAHGVNSKGEVVQTTQLFGLFQPKADNENLNVVVVEKNGKKLYALSGVIELTKAKVQVIGSTPTQGNVTVSQSAAKAAAAKAAAAKAAAAKAAAAKAAAAKAAAKAAAAKAAAATKKA
jgi:topoisomerase IA-like protein